LALDDWLPPEKNLDSACAAAWTPAMLPDHDNLASAIADFEARQRERERSRLEIERLRNQAQETLIESQALLELADKILIRR
jgi:hypothetical protein